MQELPLQQGDVHSYAVTGFGDGDLAVALEQELSRFAALDAAADDDDALAHGQPHLGQFAQKLRPGDAKCQFGFLTELGARDDVLAVHPRDRQSVGEATLP